MNFMQPGIIEEITVKLLSNCAPVNQWSNCLHMVWIPYPFLIVKGYKS